MLLTIHNLPSSTRYADVKTLLQEKCGLTEIIVDNLVNEGKNKKVTVGLASEDDGAFVVRKLNGLFINGQQLYIENRRQPTANQPYRQASFEPDSNTMQPAMAPPAVWNQNVTPYMQPMPVDQTVVKMEKDGDNEAIVESRSLTNITIKTEPVEQAPGETCTKYDRRDCPGMQLKSIKTELPDETMPAVFSKNNFTKKQLKKLKKKRNQEESASKHINHTQSLTAKKDHTPFKEEKYEFINSIPKKKFQNPLQEKDNQVRHFAAGTLASNIMGPGYNQCGKRKHRIRCPGHGLEKLVYKRVKNVVFLRLRDIFGDTLYTNSKDHCYLVKCYKERFGTSDPLLYNQMYEICLKEYKPPSLPKPKVDTSYLPTLMPLEWQAQYLTDKVKSETKL